MRRLARSVLVLACACKPAPPPAKRPVPIETPASHERVEPTDTGAVEPTPAPSLELDAALAGFTREGQPDGLLIRVVTIEPFGPDAEALAQGFVEVMPQIYGCYEQHPVAGRSWLSVEVGKYGEPKSIKVHLGPGEVDPALDACASKAMQSLHVPDEASIALFSLEVFSNAADASTLPPAEPGQRVEARYGAGCYRWIEEPPCPPRKRCEVDRWELCVCQEAGVRTLTGRSELTPPA